MIWIKLVYKPQYFLFLWEYYDVCWDDCGDLKISDDLNKVNTLILVLYDIIIVDLKWIFLYQSEIIYHLHITYHLTVTRNLTFLGLSSEDFVQSEHPGTNIIFRTNLPCRASTLWFWLARHNFWLARNNITYGRKACIVYHWFKDLKTIFFSVMLHCLHIIRYKEKMCLAFRKSACPFGQVKTCSKALFSKIHLLGQAG